MYLQSDVSECDFFWAIPLLLPHPASGLLMPVCKKVFPHSTFTHYLDHNTCIVVAIYKLGFTGHKQFEHLTCSIEGELARSVCCSDFGDEQYGIDTY